MNYTTTGSSATFYRTFSFLFSLTHNFFVKIRRNKHEFKKKELHFKCCSIKHRGGFACVQFRFMAKAIAFRLFLSIGLNIRLILAALPMPSKIPHVSATCSSCLQPAKGIISLLSFAMCCFCVYFALSNQGTVLSLVIPVTA